MDLNKRRDFLKGSALAAGAAAWSLGSGNADAAARPEKGADAPATETPSSGFLRAVREGDLPAVERALRKDPGLAHARDLEGRSAFAVALLNRHRPIADLIAARGHRSDLHEAALALDWDRFDALAHPAPGLVNQDHPVGGTAMFAAALGGSGTDIWRVYRYSGDPNAVPRKDRGHSALRAALEFPDLATAELTAASLASNGADPNLPEANGSSALHAAAERGSVEVVEILLRKGARPDVKDAEGRTPLEAAESAGQRSTAEMLRSHESVPRDCDSSRTAYDVEGKPYRAPDLTAFSALERERVVGAAHFKIDAVREAVGRHPQLAHSVATTTEISVEACAHTGRVEIVDYLLDQGAPYSLPTAAMRNDLRRVRELLDEDPRRIHERGAHDFALLWYSVIGGGSIEIAQLLLERGADVERQHWLGTTALHWAASAGETDMVQLFVEHGADVNRVGRKFSAAGETPLQRAIARDRTDVVRQLRDLGARG